MAHPFVKVQSTVPALLASLLLTALLGNAKDTWNKVESKSFLVVGDVREQSLWNVARKLEQFRNAFKLSPNLKTTSPLPIRVIVFKKRRTYLRFAAPEPFLGTHIDDYYWHGDSGNYIALRIESDSRRTAKRDSRRKYWPDSAQRILHRYVHFQLRRETPVLPLWVEEGLADYYSSFEVSADGKKGLFGLPIRDNLKVLRGLSLPSIHRLRIVTRSGHRSWFPLQTLFAVDRKSPYFLTGGIHFVFHAQSWALVHYFMLGNQGGYQQQFSHFLDLLSRKTPTNVAFKQSFGVPYWKLNQELTQYVFDWPNFPHSEVTFTDPIEMDPETKTTALSEAEIQYYMGDLLLNQDRYEKAETYLKRSVELDPNLPESSDALARLHFAKGEDLDQGVGFAKRALELSPDRKDFALTLARLYIRQGNHDAARQILTPLATSKNPHFSGVAREMLKSTKNQNVPAGN